MAAGLARVLLGTGTMHANDRDSQNDESELHSWWRRPRWRLAFGGFLLGVAYTGVALLVGAQLTVAGRDLTLFAGGVIEVSFAAFGYGLGLVIEARRGERLAARALHEQLEVLADTQRRLAQAEKLASLGQLAGAIAHEVRNPLAILRSLVQNLDEALAASSQPASPSAIGSEPTPSDPRAQCAMLLEEIDRLAHVTSSLVDFARPPKLTRVTMPATELVERVALLAGQMMRASTVRLATEGPVRGHPVAGRSRTSRRSMSTRI